MSDSQIIADSHRAEEQAEPIQNLSDAPALKRFKLECGARGVVVAQALPFSLDLVRMVLAYSAEVSALAWRMSFKLTPNKDGRVFQFAKNVIATNAGDVFVLTAPLYEAGYRLEDMVCGAIQRYTRDGQLRGVAVAAEAHFGLVINEQNEEFYAVGTSTEDIVTVFRADAENCTIVRSFSLGPYFSVSEGDRGPERFALPCFDSVRQRLVVARKWGVSVFDGEGRECGYIAHVSEPFPKHAVAAYDGVVVIAADAYITRPDGSSVTVTQFSWYRQRDTGVVEAWGTQFVAGSAGGLFCGFTRDGQLLIKTTHPLDPLALYLGSRAHEPVFGELTLGINAPLFYRFDAKEGACTESSTIVVPAPKRDHTKLARARFTSVCQNNRVFIGWEDARRFGTGDHDVFEFV